MVWRTWLSLILGVVVAVLAVAVPGHRAQTVSLVVAGLLVALLAVWELVRGERRRSGSARHDDEPKAA